MRTRSQTSAANKKIQDSSPNLEQVNEEPTLTTETTATTSKRRKKTQTLPIQDETKSVMVEKRLRGYVRKPKSAIRVRIKRALDQRLYLLASSSTSGEPIHREYRVFGQTGNVYTVTISNLPSCTCPDHVNGYLCKHIFFVLHRVLKVDRQSPLLYQKAFLTSELNEIFANADAHRNAIFNDSNVLAEREVREAYRVATGDPDAIVDTVTDTTVTSKGTTATMVQQKPITADDECPICFETMEDEANDANKIFFCSTSCGNNMHMTCFNKWRRAKVLTGESVTCPFCRIEWKTETIDNPAPTNAMYTTTGYLNLAAHATTVTNDFYDNRWYYYRYRRYYSNYSRRRRRRR
ncbi:unnamed protein product [Rotaria sp. Silwood1]|nr:unnamed protein product [Rotaria sp. Silwood1]